MRGWLLPSMILLAAPVSGATLEVEHTALSRLLATHAMTDGGRLYLDGDSESPCRYVFVQEPRVDAEAGRLRITFLFSGRQAAGVAGRCVGPGGTFDLRLTGVPRFADGFLVLDEPRLEALGPGRAFFEVVAPLVERGLQERLRVSLAAVLGHAALTLGGAWGVQLGFSDLVVEEIAVGESSTRLRLDATALVR